MKRTTKMALFCSLLIILAAQFSVNVFFADFEISIAVVLLPVFLSVSDRFPLLPTAFLSAAGVFLMRLFLSWLRGGSLDAARTLSPEILFYVCYGILLFAANRICQKKDFDLRIFLVILALIDYVSNLTELFVREGTRAFDLSAQAGIFLVAVLRTLLVWCILTAMEQYRMFLLRREHEKRYQELLLLISRLNGEVLWMDKNTALIEKTMSTAYRLYDQLKADPSQEAAARSALAVAGDVHEIKKEYFLIMRGISEVLDQELKSSGMYMDEILHLLKGALTRLGKEKGKEVVCSIHCPHKLYTTSHYAWMSVFRNLFTNALEAETGRLVQIEVTQKFAGETCIFRITDHGPGIPAESQEEIFQPGFSTKINYETGEISRGLGLNLVQNLVEEQFHGQIRVSSRPGETTFTIQIPKTEFTEERMI